MTRVEENKKLMDILNKKAVDKPDGTFEEMLCWQAGAISSFLADISKSLAIIADKEQNND